MHCHHSLGVLHAAGLVKWGHLRSIECYMHPLLLSAAERQQASKDPVSMQ